MKIVENNDVKSQAENVLAAFNDEEALENGLEKAHNFHMSGDLQASCEVYNAIIDEIPECDEAWGQLGMIGAELGDLNNALLCLENASRLMPENSQYHSVKGDLYQMAGLEEEAIECYQKTLSINSGDSHAVSQLALISQNVLVDAVEQPVAEFDVAEGL